jgi:hypothetical protein
MIATVPSDCVRVRDALPGHAYGCNQPCPTSVAPGSAPESAPELGTAPAEPRAIPKESTTIARSVPPVQATMRVDRPAPCTTSRPWCCLSSVCGRSVQAAPVAGSTMPQRQCGLFSSGGRPRPSSPSVGSGVVMAVHVRQAAGCSAPSPRAALVTPATTAVPVQPSAGSRRGASAPDTAFPAGPILPEAHSEPGDGAVQ